MRRCRRRLSSRSSTGKAEWIIPRIKTSKQFNVQLLIHLAEKTDTHFRAISDVLKKKQWAGNWGCTCIQHGQETCTKSNENFGLAKCVVRNPWARDLRVRYELEGFEFFEATRRVYIIVIPIFVISHSAVERKISSLFSVTFKPTVFLPNSLSSTTASV